MNPWENYPQGGGTVGAANEAASVSAEPAKEGKSFVSPKLAKAMMSKLKRKTGTPPRPVASTKGGMQSSLGGGTPSGQAPAFPKSAWEDGFTK